MMQVNIPEAKTEFSKLIRLLETKVHHPRMSITDAEDRGRCKARSRQSRR